MIRGRMMRTNKIFNSVLAILIVLIWLMPVSSMPNTLNETMIRNCYWMNIIVLLAVIIYEKTIRAGLSLISLGMIALLLICTWLFHSYYENISVVSFGYLYNYISFCLLININPRRLSKVRIWDALLDVICVLLITVGILMFLGNEQIEQFLRTFYVNHYSYVYTVMFMSKKTVTFFATHSISCFIYFMIWWMLEYRNSIKFEVKNIIFMIGIIFDIVMCLSVSAVMCSIMIAGYYYIKWTKKATKRNIIFSLILIVGIILAVITNASTIDTILSSNVNGINGRLGTNGNLWATLKFALQSLIPFGLCDVTGYWLTDGGYFMHFIRGGVLLIVLYYYGLFKLLKNNIKDANKRYVLFFSLMLFEIGYQFTNCMRFFMIMLFLLCFCQYKDANYQVNNGETNSHRKVVFNI